jgi:hypothetical protein
MTILPPEVVVALSLGLPTLAFAILTWWETRRRAWRARGNNFRPEPTHHLLVNTIFLFSDMESPLFEMLMLSHATLQTRLTISAAATFPRLAQRGATEERTVNGVYPSHLENDESAEATGNRRSAA